MLFKWKMDLCLHNQSNGVVTIESFEKSVFRPEHVKINKIVCTSAFTFKLYPALWKATDYFIK